MDYYLVINPEIIDCLTIPVQSLTKVAEIVLYRLKKTIKVYLEALTPVMVH